MPDGQAAHVRGLRARSKPDADLPRARAYRIGNDTVEPEARERQRHEPTQHGDFGRQSHRARAAIGVNLAYANLRELQAVNMYWRPSG